MQTQPDMVPFSTALIPAVLDLWKAALPYSSVPGGRLQKLLSDPYAAGSDAAVAVAGGRAVGFAVAIYEALSNGQPAAETGYVTVVAVHPDYQSGNLGLELLTRAEKYLKSHGLKQTLATAFPGFYFFPGIDIRYRFLTDLFAEAGFKVQGEPVDMEVQWGQYEPPSWLHEAEEAVAREGFVIDHARAEHHGSFLSFMRENFWGSWYARAKAHMESGENLDRAVLVLNESREAVGFVRFGVSGKRGSIDSIGVRKDLRGKRLGSVLLSRALQGMADRGAKQACFGYTGAIRFYESVGACIVRQYRQFQKEAPRCLVWVRGGWPQ